MVFETIIHSLWTGIVGTVKSVTQQDKDNRRNTLPYQSEVKVIDYNKNKNIHRLPHPTISGPVLKSKNERVTHIENINRKKFLLEKRSNSNSNMKENLEHIKNSTKKTYLDSDAEYYRHQSNQNRMKQTVEKNVFNCLTCKDTSISEHNTVLFKNMPYTQYTKTNNEEIPWELQPMTIKTEPDILKNVNLINDNDRDILKNIFKK